jgi:hypothetical protein
MPLIAKFALLSAFLSAAKIHRELRTINGENLISEGTVRQWCRMFKDGGRDVHCEEQSIICI